jgi:polyhydroxyalkanoate synthase
MMTQLDMSAETPLGLFVTNATLEAAKRYSAKQGVLEGAEMARIFAWLRPNDLIWNYWVNNYLLGNEPPAFDVLAWNADNTRLSAAFHGDLLDVIKDNSLVKGKLVVRGTPIDLSKIGHDHRLGHYLMRRLSRGISPPMVAAVFVLA